MSSSSLEHRKLIASYRGDLDLLIPRESVDSAIRSLIERGYVASGEMTRGFSEKFTAERSFLRMDKRPAQIDLLACLHYTVLLREDPDRLVLAASDRDRG